MFMCVGFNMGEKGDNNSFCHLGLVPAKHNNRKTEDMKMKLASLFARRSGLKLKQVVLRLCAGLRGRKSTSPSCVINKTRDKKSIMQCLEFKKRMTH